VRLEKGLSTRRRKEIDAERPSLEVVNGTVMPEQFVSSTGLYELECFFTLRSEGGVRTF